LLLKVSTKQDGERRNNINSNIQDLLQNTKTTHADYEDLRISLWKMQRVADYINDKKRESENIHEVLTVQDKLTGKFDV
jgi:hypothetical protein